MSGRISIDNLSDSLKEMIENSGMTEEQIIELLKSKGINELQTNSKNVIDAINELFQNANNGKELIADAIGEPVSSDDTFSAMSNDIHGLLSTFKTNMMKNGVTVNSGDKFKALIDKIATMVEDGEGKGLMYINGTATEKYSKSFTRLVFSISNKVFSYIEIPKPDFSPMFIIVSRTYSSSGTTTTSGELVVYDSNSNNVFYSQAQSGDSTGVIFEIDSNISDDTYIYLPTGVGGSGSTIEYHIIGVGEEDTTLRDSLAGILGDKGVVVSPEDDMVTLIGKVDSIKTGDCTNQDLINVLNNVGYQENKDYSLVSLATSNVNMDTNSYIRISYGHGRTYPLAIHPSYDKYTLGIFKPKINFSNYKTIKLRAATTETQSAYLLFLSSYVASGSMTSSSKTIYKTVNLTTTVTTYEIDVSDWTGEGYLAIEMDPYKNGSSGVFLIDSIELIANKKELTGNETTEELLLKLNRLTTAPRLVSGSMITLDNPVMAIGTGGTYYHTYTHKAPSGTIKLTLYIDEYRNTTNVTVVHKRNGVQISSTKFETVEEYSSSVGDYVAVNQYKDYEVQTGDIIEFTFVKGSGSGDRIDTAKLTADIIW